MINISCREGYDSFAICDIVTGETTGRYISRSPSAAARKAANRLSKLDKFAGLSSFTFFLRKTTRGSNKEIYRFSVSVVLFDVPLVIRRAGVVVSFSRKIEVTRIAMSVVSTS